ncbi:MAG: AAA family ATPase [Rhodospirillaceae bacterium]|nr:AAA family ATPase [Rhodospirillaceae bacterium]
MPVAPLSTDRLFTRTDLSGIDFKTTNDVEDVDALIGQERALGAVHFAADMTQRGYNLFVIGPKASGKHMAVQNYLDARAKASPTPPDRVYVNNFEDARQPHALTLPPGSGPRLKSMMAETVRDLRGTAASLFEGEDYRLRLDAINKSFGQRHDAMFEELRQEASENSMGLIRTPQGLAIAPVNNGEPMAPETFNKLSPAEQEDLQKKIETLQDKLVEIIRKVPALERDRQATVRKLVRSAADDLVGQQIAEIASEFEGAGDVQTYLTAVKTDMVDNIQLFLAADGGADGEGVSGEGSSGEATEPREKLLRRYEVNVLVSNAPGTGASIITEDFPTLGHLIGRVEHHAHMGALTTDFTLIKPGALHRADGGYLLIDMHKLLMSPYSWEGLKRTLYSGKVTIESPMDSAMVASMVSLQPEPIPVSVKVVLFGDFRLHMMLTSLDQDFADLFKVSADFQDRFDRTDENDTVYVRLIATIVRRNQLRAFEKGAVARVIEHCSRMVEDSEKLTTRVGLIADLLREADYWAGEKKRRTVKAIDIDRAIEAQIHRSDRVRESMLEQIQRGTILIDTDGAKVGQINALSVMAVGNFAFGKPSRVSAAVRMGTGKVIDIEREVSLGGPLHSKGVLILSSYLAANYATDYPISLAASLVFEQSYGGIDGDSASSTELYALLSALSGVAIKQSLAVTGSVNQMGEVQAIGGVNEKIEGFFDVCQAGGLTGRQGVLIPASNVKHLMLRRDIVQACNKRRFHVWPVATIAEGIELLTGVSAGERGKDGTYPDGSVNRLVEDRLIGFAEKRRGFSRKKAEDGKDTKK